MQANVADREDRQRLVGETLSRFGQIDLLVNNAGMAPRQRLDILEMGEESYDEILEVNLRGPFFLTQLIAKTMLEQADSREGSRSVPSPTPGSPSGQRAAPGRHPGRSVP